MHWAGARKKTAERHHVENYVEAKYRTVDRCKTGKKTIFCGKKDAIKPNGKTAKGKTAKLNAVVLPDQTSRYGGEAAGPSTPPLRGSGRDDGRILMKRDLPFYP